MAGEILTPITVWKNFRIEKVPTAQTIGEFKNGNVLLSRVRIDGRVCQDGQVKIYAVYARNVKKTKQNAIIIFQKFLDGASEKLVMEFAERGYCAMVVDLSGKDGINYNYTEYPQSLSYANYLSAKGSLDKVTDQVTKTPWYEWGVTARYALKYLKSFPFVEKVGGFGISDSATVLWHLAGTTEELDCVAFFMNAGWSAYSGNFKFKAEVDAQFTDEQLKYLAGIEPQAYANRLKCPTFIAVPTNSPDCDFDRAHDTLARINTDYYKTIYYSVGDIDCIDNQGFINVCTFFDKFLKNKGTNSSLATLSTIKCEQKGNKLSLTVIADKSKLKEVKLYSAEEQYNPSLRQWQKLSHVSGGNGVYDFEYQPFFKSGVAFFFAVAVYQNGFEVGSDVVAKKFSQKDFPSSYARKVVYSSREDDATSSFYPAGKNTEKPYGVVLHERSVVEEKKGAMDITGVTCKNGLLSFKVGIKKYAPSNDSLLLMDVYVKEKTTVTVKLISDYFGARCEFIASAIVNGGEVWHNLKFTINQFKSLEGMAIRSIEKIQAIEIAADKDFLINNLLWV